MAFYYNNKSLGFILLTCLLIYNCKNEEKAPESATKKVIEYEMYQPSEMANFMNAMYAYNEQLKTKIVAGETPSAMPLDLLKLHSAEMTSGKSRTENWQSFVNVFIESQNTIIDTLSNLELKERFNASINNCLGCHKTECTGPIPKIKKLLIQ
ncbi:hypothetical protein [uncultured Winogradskyella sp.]|uniref:hypothetical protein n=1 Tax=uncultured Winogradskyella sp. TaxID=395353 RepID=UPI00261DCCD8|nr:hypothetical protein [uncultured Winogradskyella sp.]|tara:strand:- start:903 stop:1361 length:459 start_codon:yes stop_codon:yes gene_type:complete